MSSLATNTPVPWNHFADFPKEVQSILKCDSLALAVFEPRRPEAGRFLAGHKVVAQTLRKWSESSFKQDALLKKALQKGMARGKTAKTRLNSPLPPSQQALVLTEPASLNGKRVWYLALGRKRSSGFSAEDELGAIMLLRMIRNEFDHMPEPDMARLVMTEDESLIHADPRLEWSLTQAADGGQSLLAEVRAVVDQRWPEAASGEAHDMVLSVMGYPTWVRVIIGDAVPGSEVQQWYLELRPVEEDDVPPLGYLSDERVAAAVAYLDDHFAESPSLNELAEYVHTSPFHFHRLFTRTCDISPKHYLLRKQLQYAKWLLRASRHSIGDISVASGFASHGHFTATFHRLVGLSPREYREEY